MTRRETASIWLFWQKMRLPLRTRNPRAQLAASIWLFWQKMRPKTKGLPRIGLARLNLALLAEDATKEPCRRIQPWAPASIWLFWQKMRQFIPARLPKNNSRLNLALLAEDATSGN